MENQQQEKFTTLGVLAFAFLIVSAIGCAMLIIPLAWHIPMIIHYNKNKGRVGVGFKVCSIIFCSIIAGVLMCCDNCGESLSNNNNY